MFVAFRPGRGARLLAVGAASALWLCALARGALVHAGPPPRDRPGEEIEAVTPDSFRDAGANALINAVAPPPRPLPAVRCPEQAKCTPDSDASQFAWIFVGLTTAGMMLTTWWGAVQQKRTNVIREELSRIRIHRTSSIRAGRSLGEVKMPPSGLGRRPAATPDSADGSVEATPAVVADVAAPAPAPAAPGPSDRPSLTPWSPSMTGAPPAVAYAAARAPAPPAAPAVLDPAVRQEADARLAMAQAQLEPLLHVSRTVELWFRSSEFEATLGAAALHRGLFDRVRRGVVAAAATFDALRDTRIFPTSAATIDAELERYWEQVYETLDDVYRTLNLVTSDEGRAALAVVPGGDSVRAGLDKLLDSARDYLASDGRRPIPIEPLRTDFDRRIHVAVDSRRVPGVPQGKVLSVVRCGIARDGKLVRRPEVVQSL